MTIDTNALPDAAIVDTIGEHFHKGQTYLTTMKDVRQRGDLTVLRVLLPIPEGVTLDAAVEAFAALEPVDPDAEWVDRIAHALHERKGFSHDWARCLSREKLVDEARAFLAVAREVGL